MYDATKRKHILQIGNLILNIHTQLGIETRMLYSWIPPFLIKFSFFLSHSLLCSFNQILKSCAISDSPYTLDRFQSLEVVVSLHSRLPMFESESQFESVVSVSAFFLGLGLSPSPRGLHRIRASSSRLLLLDEDVPPDGVL